MSNELIKKRAQIEMLKRINSSKRGQIGETMTWIVATIIIILILTISIIIANFSFGKDREIKIEQNSDIIASKSFFSYILTKDSNGKTIYNQLQTEENLNDFNGNLGFRIFNGSYDAEYSDIWLGFSQKDNDYFGVWTGLLEGERSFNAIQESIKLDENKTLQLVLVK